MCCISRVVTPLPCSRAAAVLPHCGGVVCGETCVEGVLLKGFFHTFCWCLSNQSHFATLHHRVSATSHHVPASCPAGPSSLSQVVGGLQVCRCVRSSPEAAQMCCVCPPHTPDWVLSEQPCHAHQTAVQLHCLYSAYFVLLGCFDVCICC